MWQKGNKILHHFLREYLWMDNKHMKRFLMLLVPRKYTNCNHNEIQLTYQLDWLKSKGLYMYDRILFSNKKNDKHNDLLETKS